MRQRAECQKAAKQQVAGRSPAVLPAAESNMQHAAGRRSLTCSAPGGRKQDALRRWPELECQPEDRCTRLYTELKREPLAVTGAQHAAASALAYARAHAAQRRHAKACVQHCDERCLRHTLWTRHQCLRRHEGHDGRTAYHQHFTYFTSSVCGLKHMRPQVYAALRMRPEIRGLKYMRPKYMGWEAGHKGSETHRSETYDTDATQAEAVTGGYADIKAENTRH
jgi:hypothetical protein